MKLDRLLGILITLLRQDKITAPVLAEKFEVSRRTINRDIEALCLPGIPLVTEQGRGGGISIAPGYKLEKELLTEEELQAILIGVRGVDSILKQPKGPVLADKLSQRETEEQVLIDLASFYKDSLTEKISLLRDAISRRLAVSFRYYSEKGEELRQAEPCRIAYQWNAWYLIAWCRTKKEFRTFKLARLWDLTLSEEHFVPKPLPAEKADMNSLWEENYRLVAVFDPSVKYRLVEEYGPDSFTLREDGRLSFTRDFTFYGAMLSWISSFGAQVQVLQPESLREDLLRQAKLLLSYYEET